MWVMAFILLLCTSDLNATFEVLFPWYSTAQHVYVMYCYSSYNANETQKQEQQEPQQMLLALLALVLFYKQYYPASYVF